MTLSGFTGTDALGFVTFAVNVTAALLVAHSDSRLGWWLRLVTNGLQLAYAIALGSAPLVANALVFAAMNAYALYRRRYAAPARV